MRSVFKLLLATITVVNLASQDLFAAAQTTGTPLGGLGASYILYNGAKSIFVKGYRLTRQHWYQEAKFDASFNLYTKVGSTVKTFSGMRSDDEDALIPIYRVNYGKNYNNIDVKLLAFGPYVSGDEKSSVMPLAFFEFSLENKNSVSAEAAIAFQISDLAGTNPQRRDSISGVYWSGTSINADNSALGAASDMSSAKITTGSSLTEFNASGTLSNKNGGVVAVKLNLKPSQTGKIRFVLGWYQTFTDRNWDGKLVDEGFYYMNYIKSSIDAVKYGLSEFVRIRDGASGFANRIRAVNLPDWYTDRLLNNLYPLTHNSQYAKDGRFAWREGKYFIIGTIDQQGHSQIASSYNWPEGQWRQMLFWARTQRRGDFLGQIHHDFNGPKSGSEKINALCDWDDHDHRDYWWSKTTNWSDLNSLFIINIYELFLATGNMDTLNTLWPYMMNTAERILLQAKRCIDNQYMAPPSPFDSTEFVLPYQCLGSYDREGATNEYNGSLALVAYSALAEMCRARGDEEGGEKWDEIFERGKKQFSAIYSSKPHYATNSEGELGVYNFSRHLGLPVIMSDEEANRAFDNYWDKSVGGRDLLPWHFYTINHFGDFGIAIGKVDEGLAVHYNDYEQHCVKRPNYYFWQDLDASPGMHTYMTAPVVWHSLMLITGFCMDKFNQRLWIRPLLPSQNNGRLTNAPLVSPGNWGTLDYLETESGKTQEMSIQFDNTMPVKEIILKNPSEKKHGLYVVLGGRSVPYKATYLGKGLDAVIKIKFDDPIEIDPVNVLQIGVDREIAVRRFTNGRTINSLSVRNIDKKQVIEYSIQKRGKVDLAVYSANGVQVRKINVGIKTAGNFSQTINNLSNGFYYIQLIHDGKCISTASMVITK